MLKRTLIICSIYIILILSITLNRDTIGESYVFLLLIFTLAFPFFLIPIFYKKYIADFKPKNKITYENSENLDIEIKKISTRPFLFGLENKFLSDDEFYFDNENFYAINKKFKKAIFKLTDIEEISKTSLQINNRRIWQVKINDAAISQEITFKFADNYTIWNTNFYHFYEKVRLINPNAIKSKWSLWKM